MEDVSYIQSLVINGLSPMTTNQYEASIESFSQSRYSIQYDNIFAGSNSYSDLLISILILVIAAICSGLLLFHLTVIIFSRRYLYRFSTPDITFRTNYLFNEPDDILSTIFNDTTDGKYHSIPGVSIIKPLTGVDDAVLMNLRSFFYLDYPKYELIFCVADADDPVVPYIEDLILEHKEHVEANLIINCGAEICVNPKINNMNRAYNSAKYELILISDVGIYMFPNTLSDMVITMLSEENVGLVHQVPFMFPYQFTQILKTSDEISNTKCSNSSQNFIPPCAWIHQLVYFGCWHAKMYMGAAMLGINCTTGMSCLMRKDALDSIGGLIHFGRYLAEDFFFSKFYYDSGWKVRVSSQPAWQNAIVPEIKQFQDRMLRWYQLRIAMVPVACLLEPFSGCFINGILHAFCYSYLFPHIIDPVVFFFFHVLIWFLLDFTMLHQIYPPGCKISITKSSFFTMWAFYESTALFTQLRAFATKDIHWRGKKYRLEWGGKALRIDKPTMAVYDDIKASTTLVNFEDESYHECDSLSLSTFESDYSSNNALDISMTKFSPPLKNSGLILSSVKPTADQMPPLLNKISTSIMSPGSRSHSCEEVLKTPGGPCTVQ